MGLRERQTCFDEDGFEILFHTLLRVKARGILVWLPTRAQFPARGMEVAFRFTKPL